MISQVMSVGRHMAVALLASIAVGYSAGELFGASDPGAGSANDPVEGVTYHREVSRILQSNCVTCHRSGGIGPFALDSYERVYQYRNMVLRAVEAGRMPPWFASPEYGHFANDRSLDPIDRQMILAWIAAGAPEGDPADAPAPLQLAEGWHIGEPDLVLQLPEAFVVPAEGEVPYQYMVVRMDFPEDRWVEAVEIRPTAMPVTHHILSTLRVPHPTNPDSMVTQGNGGVDGYFALMVPGSTGLRFGEGRAKRIPAGSNLLFQLHYTAMGESMADQSKIGFIFADGPPDEVVETVSAYNVRFRIPPGAKDYEVVGEYDFEEPGRVLSFMPHTHVRGTAFRYELIRPDGSSEIVLDLPDYDFNWQLDYVLAEPLHVEAGSVMRATAWYDNSADNPSNPDPTVEVRFGEQTWEEMMIGYFDWIPASGVRTASAQ